MRTAINLLPQSFRRQQILRKRSMQWASIISAVLVMGWGWHWYEMREDRELRKQLDTLTRELGENFLRVELEGRGHATLTAHRQQVAVDRVLAFFGERLRPEA